MSEIEETEGYLPAAYAPWVIEPEVEKLLLDLVEDTGDDFNDGIGGYCSYSITRDAQSGAYFLSVSFTQIRDGEPEVKAEGRWVLEFLGGQIGPVQAR